MDDAGLNLGLLKTPILYVIVPCYNEEQVLPETAFLFLENIKRLIELKKIDEKSRILFVNDGSTDNTWELICKYSEQYEHFVGISQSRNYGHQNALLAGLMEAKSMCDITISIDADGQDDISVMEQMVDEYYKGAEIVYGVRSTRETDSFFKKFTAELFYKLMKWLGADIVFNHADYRLISSRVLNEFEKFKEVNLFIRGLIPLVGFKSSIVYYERKKRISGCTHYPLYKMLTLAIDAITSLTIKPIHLIIGFGLLICVIGFLGILWVAFELFKGNTVEGWALIMCAICFLGGLQLLSLGIIGQYIGKIYLETKQRPRYIINDRTWD